MSSLKSSFGQGTMAPTGFDNPAPRHSSHGILHNLLADAINTAKGIPFGMVQTVEHPVRSLKLMGQSYADTYGHGWHHFEQSFMAHPLQPLLDAISVPLIAAGGIGVGVKAASFGAEIGRTAEMADLLAQSSKAVEAGDFAKGAELRAQAMRHPGLDKAAQHFRKGTPETSRMVKTALPGVELPYAYSSNLFRRAMTRGSMALMEGVGNKMTTLARRTNEAARPNYFSTESLGKRMLVKEESKRAAGTANEAKGEAAVLYGAKKQHEAGVEGFDPHTVINRLGDHVEHGLIQGALKVDEKYAEELAASPRFATGFQFIYEKPAEAAYLDKTSDFTVGPGGETTRTPFTAHPAKDAGLATRESGLGGYETDQMLNAIHTLPERVVTGNNPALAMRQDGKVLVIRKGTKEAYTKELEDSARLANLIYRAPLVAWKGFILGLSPRYFVNNVIGNAGMLAAATNPVEFSRGVLASTKAVKGIRAEAKVARGMETTLDDLMNKWLPQEWVHRRAGYLQHGAMGIDQTAGARLKNPVKRAGHAKLYSVTETVAYRGTQRISLMGALSTDGDFRNLYRVNKAKGMEEGAAYRDAADTILSDPRKAAAMEKRVTDWAGQYYHLNSLEKKLTAIVPFYTWDRHALRFGKEQVLSRPVRSIVLAQLGALGDKQASKELGKVPDFMKGAIPVKGRTGGILGFMLGQNILGRKKILLSAGYNPLAAAADDADAIAAVFGQGPRSPAEAVGGQLNPIISGAIAGITGQRLFSGAKANTHGMGPIGGIVDEAGVELPHVKLVNQFVRQMVLGEKPPSDTYTVKGSKQPRHTLYEKGMRQTVSSLLGLNERDFDPGTAAKLFNEENHIKKGRRRKKKKALADLTQLTSSFK